jgi:hypothetical protein
VAFLLLIFFAFAAILATVALVAQLRYAAALVAFVGLTAG